MTPLTEREVSTDAVRINPAHLWLSTLSPAGRKGMQSQLNRCAALLNNNGNIATYPWHSLDYGAVMQVRASLMGQGYAVATINMALSALKSVANTAFNLGLLDATTLTTIKTIKRVSGDPKRQGRALTKVEIRAMLNAAGDFSIARCQRDKAILLLLCGAGLRAGELVSLDIGDVDIPQGILHVRQGKGRKNRDIHLALKVHKQLVSWLKVRGDHTGPLFTRISRADRPGTQSLTKTGLTGVLMQLRTIADISYFTPHDLRRTFITQLLEQGADLNIVRQLAGHADVSTTTRYDCRGQGVVERISRGFICW
ncbi:tyrosine-type recombinase/integrase [Aeromonas caviae]|uniref:Integrase n=1 Tax=Aeromonas caviae TaxID=648 RepID=A0AA37CZG8_AERCA|nr:site-specific integrase [Aeromonas caviae]MBL0588051.1 site-specific integrase [Aeromonas caviae]GJA17013.1 integrase [Aeromonas caviae]GJA25945.1 integrase [Aeromonas caviae]GJA63991.1 integrase [Aeromonas caviae]GJA70706.1 integrase [Aeromonas caviae]